MSFFKRKEPLFPMTRPEEPKPKPEPKKEPMAFGAATEDNVLFTSNVSIPVKISFRPKGSDEKTFSIELYIAADLKGKYSADGLVFGEWHEVADVTKALDGYYDVVPRLSQIAEPDRGLDIRDFGEYLAQQYLVLLQSVLERQNDLYLIGIEYYSTVSYNYGMQQGHCEPPAPKCFIQESLAFHSPDLPEDVNGYFVLFKDSSVRYGNTRNTGFWGNSVSQKTRDYLGTQKGIELP